jgi:hypothetical protein
MIEERIVPTDVPARDTLLVEAWKPCITLVIGMIMDSATATVN